MSAGDIRIIRHERIDSTNDEAKRLIACAGGANDIPFDTVIVAGEQTAGRGRSGRDFVSPKADSLYLSFVLRPGKAVNRGAVRGSDGREATCEQATGEGNDRREMIRDQALEAEIPWDTSTIAENDNNKVTHEQAAGEETPLTIIAAVAVCEAIEAMDSQSGVTPKIKWVNDIYVDGRKICGILAEAVSGKGSKSIDALVLGIGVNINAYMDAFPSDIRDITGSLAMDKSDVEPFMYEIISRIYARMDEASGAETDEPSPSVMDEYRRRSLMPGREISVVRADGQTARAVAQRIEDDGSLTVEFPDGTIESLNAGEVHLVMGNEKTAKETK